jgi:hypothetical protein
MFNLFKRKEASTGHLPPAESADTEVRRPRRDFKALYPRELELRVVVEDNPKRELSQSYKRFEKYWEAGTVGEALDAGVLYKDIDLDWTSNYISLNGKTLHE